MLIVKYYINGEEVLETDNPTHVSHASDFSTIKQAETGVEYQAAYDVYPCPYTYLETAAPLPREDKTEEETKMELSSLGIALTKIS